MMGRNKKRPLLSLCMIALNEEELIRGCLESVRGLADEIVVGLDTRTTDRTGPIARGYGARFIPIEWSDDFAAARNATLEAARGEWVLVLDADDRLTDAGRQAVSLAMQTRGDTLTGFMFEIAERYLDGRLMFSWLGASRRLFRRLPDARYFGRVHEDVRSPGNCMLLPNGPHIDHLGSDLIVWERRQKDSRNRRLLELQLLEEPANPAPHYHLALQHHQEGRVLEAIDHARRGLEIAGLAGFMRTELEGYVTTGQWIVGRARTADGGRAEQLQALTGGSK